MANTGDGVTTQSRRSAVLFQPDCWRSYHAITRTSWSTWSMLSKSLSPKRFKQGAECYSKNLNGTNKGKQKTPKGERESRKIVMFAELQVSEESGRTQAGNAFLRRHRKYSSNHRWKNRINLQPDIVWKGHRHMQPHMPGQTCARCPLHAGWTDSSPYSLLVCTLYANGQDRMRTWVRNETSAARSLYWTGSFFINLIEWMSWTTMVHVNGSLLPFQCVDMKHDMVTFHLSGKGISRRSQAGASFHSWWYLHVTADLFMFMTILRWHWKENWQIKVMVFKVTITKMFKLFRLSVAFYIFFPLPSVFHWHLYL